MAERRPAKRIGSAGVAGVRLRGTIPEELDERIKREAERIGIDHNDWVRQALVTVLDAPRRREDFMALIQRIAAVEARVDALERKDGG